MNHRPEPASRRTLTYRTIVAAALVVGGAAGVITSALNPLSVITLIVGGYCAGVVTVGWWRYHLGRELRALVGQFRALVFAMHPSPATYLVAEGPAVGTFFTAMFQHSSAYGRIAALYRIDWRELSDSDGMVLAGTQLRIVGERYVVAERTSRVTRSTMVLKPTAHRGPNGTIEVRLEPELPDAAGRARAIRFGTQSGLLCADEHELTTLCRELFEARRSTAEPAT